MRPVSAPAPVKASSLSPSAAKDKASSLWAKQATQKIKATKLLPGALAAAPKKHQRQIPRLMRKEVQFVRTQFRRARKLARQGQVAFVGDVIEYIENYLAARMHPFTPYQARANRLLFRAKLRSIKTLIRHAKKLLRQGESHRVKFILRFAKQYAVETGRMRLFHRRVRGKLRRIANAPFVHELLDKADKFAERGDIKGVRRLISRAQKLPYCTALHRHRAGNIIRTAIRNKAKRIARQISPIRVKPSVTLASPLKSPRSYSIDELLRNVKLMQNLGPHR